MVGGRTVEVDLALSQDDARNLASGGRSTAAGKDNRNLYLVMPIGIAWPCVASCPGMHVCPSFKNQQLNAIYL